MTGLEPERCHIIEIATLVTDSNLEILAEGPDLVIHNTDEQLTTLSEWSLDQFTRSGLLEEVRRSDVSCEDAETRTLQFLSQHVTPGSSPLCGNSVHHDRAFLYHRMPRLHAFLHYRNIDVSTVKELAQRWYPGRVNPPPKADSHRAMADVREAVHELRYYRAHFFTSPSSS
jgi:oligoribonuclease